jgi:phosphate starvation-inducible PhoH-like protein
LANGNGKPLKKVRIDDLLTFKPITQNQEKTYKAYKEGNHLLLHGIAGTGKTFLSLYLALEEVLDPSSIYEDVFIVRSVVSTRDIGFLPGDEQEKVSIYEAPYRSICRELFGIRDAYDALKQQAKC